MPNEHKFYVALSEIEVQKILNELRPVLVSQEGVETTDKLIERISGFKDKP